MCTHSDNALETFVMNPKIAIDAHIRCLNDTPNDSRAMITMRSCGSLAWFLIVMVDKMMAKDNL